METFSMPLVPCIFSLGIERPLRRHDPRGNFPNKITHHHGVSVYGHREDEVFYRESRAFEISGFYSDEETDDIPRLPSQSRKAFKPIGSSGALPDVASPDFSSEVQLPVIKVTPPTVSLPARSTRKRSLTNLFKAMPETQVSCQKAELSRSIPETQIEPPSSHSSTTSDECESPVLASINHRACELQEMILTGSCVDVLRDSLCHRLNFCDQEEDFFHRKEVVEDRSFSSEAPAIRILNRGQESDTSISQVNHLLQARKTLETQTINRHIAVGCQPRISKGFTLQEENDCFQKTWLHQQNRIEAHQRMKSKLELILEEEELLELLIDV